MKEQTFSEAADAGMVELLIRDASGIYIPQEFCQSYVIQESALDDDVASCAAGPDDPYYWESWDNILEKGTIMGNSGHTWTLYQDGDLWAIRSDANINWDAE